jgi:hypothetical protein
VLLCEESSQIAEGKMLQPLHDQVEPVRRLCPDCGALLETFTTPSADPGYACPTHGAFVVSKSSEDFGYWSAAPERQRRALSSARLVASPRQSPVVILFA